MSENETHYLWAERYRPDTLDGYICDPQVKSILLNFISQQDIPHLLLPGSAGTGKTTLAKILTKNIECDHIYINASDTNGIEMVRTKIKGFASTTSFAPLKIVILDEADFFTIEAQAALRNLMETYSQSTRFILTCNYVEKICNPLISRCQVFHIEPPTKKDVAIHIKNILDKESIKYDIKDIKTVVEDFYPDIRKTINYLQQSSSTGELKLIKTHSFTLDVKTKLVEFLKKGGKTAFNDIRQLINDAGTKTVEGLYGELYSNIDVIAPDKQTEAIIIIAEYQYQSSMVIDKEITFMACVAKILVLLQN